MVFMEAGALFALVPAMSDLQSPYVPPPSEVSVPRPISKILGFVALLGIFGTVFSAQVHRTQEETKQAKQAAESQKVLKEVSQVRDENLRDLAKGDSSTQLKRMEHLEGEVNKFAATATGHEGKMARASLRLLTYCRTGSQAFQTAIKEATDAGIFEFAAIKKPADIELRRKLARNILEQNAALRLHTENTEKAMRQFLQEEQFSPAETADFLKGFLERHQRTLPIARKIRDANQNMVQALIQICDLLDHEWGQWKALEDGSMDFKSKAASVSFAKLMASVEQAVQDEKTATQDFVARARGGQSAQKKSAAAAPSVATTAQ
jgi:hypothetical protein